MRGAGRPLRALVTATVFTALATGCVGAIERAELDEIIRANGGGISEQMIDDALDLVAVEVGTGDFEITRLSVLPQTVTVRVRDPARPENLDDYTIRIGRLVSVFPVRLNRANEDDLDLAFPVSDLALDRIDEMLDTAVAEAGIDGGAPGALRAVRIIEQVPLDIVVTVADDRRNVDVRFAPDGTFLEVAG